MKTDNLKQEQQCVITRLFEELNLKHNKGEGEILLLHQDNTLFVCEQDYGDLKIIEEIKLLIPDVSKSLKCDCKHSGSCRYEEVVLETKELCRHKE